MIPISIDIDRYKYDIHSLVRAFYPREEVCVRTEEEWAEQETAPFLKICLGTDAMPELSIRLRGSRGEMLETGTWSPEGVSASEHSTNGSDDSVHTQKNVLKHLLYEMLVRETGHALPWGSLTGIRPTRIPMQMLEDGRTEEEIHTYLRELFYVSEEKRSLSIEIAHRERQVLETLGDFRNGYSLYIGIPFCPTTCLYCSFPSYAIGAWKNRVEDYLHCLDEELKLVATLGGGRSLQTIYVGGGTPTTLTAEQLSRLLAMVGERLDTGACRELTVEAGRPDSLDRDKLVAMKRAGVTRISVNPQTMNEETLQRIGRRHTVRQTIDAYRLAREEGFDNINMDLILGLPGEGEAEVRHTMEAVAALEPDDLTVHALAVKRGSRLYEQMISGKDTGELPADPPDPDRLMTIAAEGAREMGLSPYYLYRQKNMTGNLENTGYAAQGREGLYNILIMEELQDIIAIGAGTVSKRVFGDGRIERCDSVKEVAQYMDRLPEMMERKRRLWEAEKNGI